MGVYIKGMDMPISGTTLRVVEDLEGNKFLTNADCMNGLYYPLVEVKAPHGRLGDLDALRARMYHEAFETDSDMQRWESGCWIRYKLFERAEEAAPTIIPAEED